MNHNHYLPCRADLESQKTTIEGRIESQHIKGKEVLGVRVSFSDLILLGTSQSNCFHLNLNLNPNRFYSKVLSSLMPFQKSKVEILKTKRAASIGF